jgi:hypothetical protein
MVLMILGLGCLQYRKKNCYTGENHQAGRDGEQGKIVTDQKNHGTQEGAARNFLVLHRAPANRERREAKTHTPHLPHLNLSRKQQHNFSD